MAGNIRKGRVVVLLQELVRVFVLTRIIFRPVEFMPRLASKVFEVRAAAPTQPVVAAIVKLILIVVVAIRPGQMGDMFP